MKSTLNVGTSGKLRTQVGPGNTITLGDDRRATVFSTPSMINLMEHAAREALRPHLEPGEESVGVDVKINHSSATPPRSEVTAEATVTAIEKNVLSFDVVARDPWGEIGRGTHRRAVIETSRFASHLAKQKPSIPQEHAGSRAAGEGSRRATPPTDFKTLDCQPSGELLRVTLNRPNKRNAVSEEMTGEFELLLDWLEKNHSNVRVVVLRGSGDSFCAGDDVGDLPTDTDGARRLSLRRGEVYRRFTELPQVCVAAIRGVALGGGLVMASACDFRIADFGATLGLPEVTLGWLPNYGLEIIASLVGRGKLLDLALTGRLVDARHAESLGLVSRVVSAAQLESEVDRLAQHLLSMPPEALAATKQVLTVGGDWSDVRATQSFIGCIASDAARKTLERFQG